MELIDEQEFIEIKNVYSVNDSERGWKDKPQIGRKYLQKTQLIKKTVIPNALQTHKTQQ